MSFEQQIQQWVTIDNQMKTLNDKIKELRDKKNVLSQNINTHIETNNLTDSSVKLSDGQLKRKNVASQTVHRPFLPIHQGLYTVLRRTWFD